MDSSNQKPPYTRSRSFSVFNFRTQESHGQNGNRPAWKFWRHMSFRSRGQREPKSKVTKDDQGHGKISKIDIGEPVYQGAQIPSLVHGSRALPDVLERVHALPVFNANSVPPPKPPRLFLHRSPSSLENSMSSAESDDDFNRERQSFSQHDASSSADETLSYTNWRMVSGSFPRESKTTSSSSDIRENNNTISLPNVAEEESGDIMVALNNTLLRSSHRSLNAIITTSDNDRNATTNSSCIYSTISNPNVNYNTDPDDNVFSTNTSTNPLPSKSTSILTSPITNSLADQTHHHKDLHNPNSNRIVPITRKSKIVSLDSSSHKRHSRSRPRRKSSSSDKSGSAASRQWRIVSSILDLMCQRLDPYPLLEPLKRAGVLTNTHLRSFLGFRDRKLVCEGLADILGDSTPESLSAFCDVMASNGVNCTEVLELLLVMREIDRIVYDIQPPEIPPQHEHGDSNSDIQNNNNSNNINDINNDHSTTSNVPTTTTTEVPMEDTHLHFEIGYLSTDFQLKPLVELDRTPESKTASVCSESGKGIGFTSLSKKTGKTTLSWLLDLNADQKDSSEDKMVDELNRGLARLDVPPDDLEFPGLVMMGVSINGHSLAGEKSRALADVIRSHNCLSELNLGMTQLSGRDVSRITDALADKSSSAVHSLDLRLNVIDKMGARALAQLLRQTRFLRILNLASTGLDKESFLLIVSAISVNKSLIELDASFLDIEDSSCAGLRDMLRANRTLKRLRLRGNNLTSVGCQTMCKGLEDNAELSVLDLSRNPIGDEGMKALSSSLAASYITDLSIDGCGVTQHGCPALAEFISGCQKLTALDVSTNEIGDAGVAKLASSLQKSSSLTTVSLNMCCITDDGFHILLDIVERNSSILALKLCYNNFSHSASKTAIDNLRYRLRIVKSSRPDVKILLWGNNLKGF